jgi:urease accessory protein
MGAIAVRPITHADFVTPPEFAAYRLADDPTGRIGGLDLELVDKGHGVRLGHCYQQIPLRVLPPFHFDAEQPGLLYLINPTAGLFDGDGHLVRVTARKGTRTVIVGQSATRIHPSLSAFSTQQWEITVEAGATLVVLPGPTIPFAGCRSFQRVTVELAEDAKFAWGDIGLPGRYARGKDSERFRFETLIQQFEVRRCLGERRGLSPPETRSDCTFSEGINPSARQDSDLVYRDRFVWRGPWTEDVRRWHLGEHDAYGNVFMTGDVPGDTGAARFRTASGDTVVRSLGSGEATIAEVVREALGFAGLRGTPDLATNHWFSVGASV